MKCRRSYHKINNDEIEETIRAIFGTASGPKGTLMNGQTKFLEVVSGNRIVEKTFPWAHCYGGHQFGFFTGQ